MPRPQPGSRKSFDPTSFCTTLLEGLSPYLSAESEDARTARGRASLAEFIRQGWHVLEGAAPLVDNWHIDAIALHVQAALEDWHARQLWRNRHAAHAAQGEPCTCG